MVGALTGNQTCNLLVIGQCFNQLGLTAPFPSVLFIGAPRSVAAEVVKRVSIAYHSKWPEQYPLEGCLRQADLVSDRVVMLILLSKIQRKCQNVPLLLENGFAFFK